jgi:hypothetical protein
MFTTGTKLLVGSAVFAAVAAVLYGVFADGTLGVIGLTSAAVGLALVAGVNIAVRDSYVTSMDPQAVATSPASRQKPAPTLWPVATAAGAGVIVVGLVSEPIVFILGVVVMFLAGLEWVLEAWSDDASADPAYNESVRARLAGPLEFPLFAAVGAVVIVYSFSRIMLFLSKTGGPVAFGVVAFLLLVFGFIVAKAPGLKSGGIAGLCVMGALGLVTGGVAAGLTGEREIEVHETTGELAELNECSTPEETHADENASQRVPASASVHAVVTLQSDDTLVAAVPGIPRDLERITIARSTPTNVIFRNESAHERRLTLDLGDRVVLDENGDPTEEVEPDQMCTALTEDGGAQMLSFRITTPSTAADAPFQFFVPGVDGAEVEVVVP